MEISEIETLRNQLMIARNEISNLRQQVKKLSTIHSKDVENITKVLETFQCQNCALNSKPDSSLDEIDSNAVSLTKKDVSMKTIGVIKTVFSEKKGIPRQASVGSGIQGRVILDPNLFTNPEHALEGLEEFSHIWLLYYFHKNLAHSKPKVSPPRLNGKKVGVFSCRSPHRPCNIGLSLVRIEKIEGSTIYFVGTDMVDDTPIFDIKPYISQYDDPEKMTQNDQQDFYNARQAPDGEEELKDPIIPSTAASSTNNVKVAKWTQSNLKLNVIFTEEALSQLTELKLDRKHINEILASDPRTVYVRQTFKSQVYTFQMNGVTITSKFNDESSSVTVLQVKKSDVVKTTTSG